MCFIVDDRNAGPSLFCHGVYLRSRGLDEATKISQPRLRIIILRLLSVNLEILENIRSIFQNAKSQGLSQPEVQQEIEAVLTPAQLTTFQNDIAARSSGGPPLGPPPGPPPQSNAQSTSPDDPLANLDLTDDQKSKIDAILANSQANGTSPADALEQIEAVLTPGQQTAFLGDVQTVQAIVSGQSQTGSGGTSSSWTAATLSNGLSETDVQNQIAAATSLILQQFQSEVTTTTT
jgi:Spy/CpxP family protein refolding chaperone